MVLAGCFGHVFSDMEIKVCEYNFPASCNKFQLGHVFSDMEMVAADRINTQISTRFQLGHVFSDMEIPSCVGSK